MYDIVSVGSAIQDIFVFSEKFRLIHNGKKICLSYGEKINIKKPFFCIGGGAVNTSVSFRRLGLKASILARVGKGYQGSFIINELKRERVDTSLIQRDASFKTGLSVILSGPGADRTILVHRGANNYLTFPGKGVKTKWFYISALYGKSFRVIAKLIKYAERRGIQIAMNPGSQEIEKGIPDEILRAVDVLIVNKEEGSILTGKKSSLKGLSRDLCGLYGGLAVITDSSRGAVACDIYKKYVIKAPKVKAVNTTGAGDAFGSGFITGLIKKGDVDYALKLGSKNAAAVIRDVGATKGCLKGL
jgi:ribokinase